jgi:hypothetical protein
MQTRLLTVLAAIGAAISVVSIARASEQSVPLSAVDLSQMKGGDPLKDCVFNQNCAQKKDITSGNVPCTTWPSFNGMCFAPNCTISCPSPLLNAVCAEAWWVCTTVQTSNFECGIGMNGTCPGKYDGQTGNCTGGLCYPTVAVDCGPVTHCE